MTPGGTVRPAASASGCYEFNGFVPVVHESAFVHPLAAVIGNVVIGRDVYVGPGAAIRADIGGIVIEDGCNVQENCTIHTFPGTTVVLEAGAHIGHGAIVHGARIGANALVGMNAVVMDEAVVGAGSIVGALAFVPARMEVPPRKVVVGNPARVVKDVSDEMLAWKTEGTRLYQRLPAAYHATMRPVEPLREVPPGRAGQEVDYQTWSRTRATSGQRGSADR
ncbi:MAG: transferase hexapeptide repeat family protein [Gemmatimonadetes bacterium]|nr:transferase hexapeptide repeat family protein [Gemmatimonadota bacterium]